jgi:hypothetical protein
VPACEGVASPWAAFGPNVSTRTLAARLFIQVPGCITAIAQPFPQEGRRSLRSDMSIVTM